MIACLWAHLIIISLWLKSSLIYFNQLSLRKLFFFSILEHKIPNQYRYIIASEPEFLATPNTRPYMLGLEFTPVLKQSNMKPISENAETQLALLSHQEAFEYFCNAPFVQESDEILLPYLIFPGYIELKSFSRSSIVHRGNLASLTLLYRYLHIQWSCILFVLTV